MIKLEYYDAKLLKCIEILLHFFHSVNGLKIIYIKNIEQIPSEIQIPILKMSLGLLVLLNAIGKNLPKLIIKKN